MTPNEKHLFNYKITSDEKGLLIYIITKIKEKFLILPCYFIESCLNGNHQSNLVGSQVQIMIRCTVMCCS